jgi:uncharacterized membrane protein SirB2
MLYLLIKQVHMSLALLSVAGFALRWYWRMSRSPMATSRWVRIAPHLVDTLLLGTALALSFMPASDALGAAWFGAKVTGLVLYILLGMIAMRSAPRARRSIPAFVAALLVFAWIASVARTKVAAGFLQLLLA